MEVDIRTPCRRSRMTSLSFPHRGYCWRRLNTAVSSSGGAVGFRTVRGRHDRLSKLSKCRGM